MLLWMSVAVMTVVAIAGVLWPLFRKRPARSGTDAAVYRDQLQEIDRDLGFGLIGAKEAEAARIEVSRRLLAATDQGGEVVSESGWSFHRATITGFALVLLTAGSAALYLRLGTPSLAEPRVAAAASAASESASLEKLVAQAEEYLTRNPQEARGWEVLAPVYMQLGRYSDSANAWRNVVQLSGESADRLANLGEALTAEANGVVTAEAKDAFVRSVALDPTTVTAQFYLGVAAEQDGKNGDATKIFKDLIAHAPADAHWVTDVKTALARVDGKPDGAPIAAAQTSTVGNPQDNVVIRGMVEQLAERLKKDGSDPEGWVRLVRSYGVLNQPEKKSAAIADARNALGGDADKLATFEKAVAELNTNAAAAPSASQPAASATTASSPSDDPMVHSMVDRLAARLKQDGSDVQGWVKLVQSYGVLNDTEKKQTAIADARKALANDPAKLAKFESGLAALEKDEPLPADVAAPPHSPTNATAASGVGDDPSVRGMVDRLASRLKQDGSDVDGWIKLIRSYKVMQDDAAKTTAIADARKALAGDAAKLAKLETGIKAIEAGQEPPPPEPPAGGAGAGGADHDADAMVQRLADRLQRAGSDPEGWLMLVRSYATLKEPDKQKDAITKARTALAGEADKLDWFNQQIKRFKLE